MPLAFYDPLYEFIQFDQLAGASLAEVDHTESGLSRVLQSSEFTRQAFLRQNGMGFLVFPSSTHTRLAHALGACYLGRLAAERIRVHDTTTNRLIWLGEFLKSYGWTSEFYLSLLLHDVGHFPFSHTVERTHEVWELFGGTYKHETATCELIRGKGDFYEAFRRNADKYSGRSGVVPELSKAVRLALAAGESSTDPGSVEASVDAICYLIHEDREPPARFDSPIREQLSLLRELVSGLLDLDRMDHYRRDLHFNGVLAGTVLNFECLLSGITITYSPSRAKSSEDAPENGGQSNDPSNAEFRLTGSAMGQAISLLQIKARLLEDAFHHPKILSFETMLGEALRLHLEDTIKGGPTKSRVFDLLVMTDDQLLEELARDGNNEVKTLVHRIRLQVPYQLLCRLVLSPQPQKIEPDLATIKKVVLEIASSRLGRILIFGWGMKAKSQIARGEAQIERDTVRTPETEWLAIKNLVTEPDTRVLSGDKDLYEENPSRLRPTSPPSVWLFSEAGYDPQKDTWARDVVKAIQAKLYEQFDAIFDLALVPA
jgi:HD superfamily phosphohydrolase